MKTAAFAAALLLSSAALAQTSQTNDDMVQTDSQTTTTTHSMSQDMSSSTAAQPTMHMAAGGRMVQPDNSNPERDARGHRVISAAAMVPAGYNGMMGSAMGGPLESASGHMAADMNYPACSATVTDNCVQTYERGRSR